MRDELSQLWDCIACEHLPASFEEVFAHLWDADEQRFHAQEGFLLDFKDRAPKNFTESFGASIVRLAIAFYNAFGGMVVFGIQDNGFRPSNLYCDLDVEGFNNVLKRATGRPIECLFKTYRIPDSDAVIGALLVPKRGNLQPVRLKCDLGPYKAGCLWVRDRHEVASNALSNIPLLYSDRSALPTTSERTTPLPIHRSLPPSPATMHKFIGRDDLMLQLWDWFVFSDRPRVYVHGPGGSGKSTLAHEFARSVSDIGFQIVLPNGDRVDYVLFLSAKETEFNPIAGVQQDFTLRQFWDLSSELRQILFHSGNFDEERVQSGDDEELARMIEELFENYSGLIVLDDIDALSRRGQNTGEELLFLAAARARKPTRILYTLRYPPPNAAGSGVKVPGLNQDEFNSFLDACCEQFDVKRPTAQISPRIQTETSGLPLLIETVVGLRGVCGTFEEALRQFNDRGGDDARRYLYQREYDRLEPTGKSREVLAALMLLQEPVQFETIKNLLNFSREKISDAISESGAIFITSTESSLGESLYQLAEPCIPFIKAVSPKLNAFRLIERKIQIYRQQDASLTPAEAALLHRLIRLMRLSQFKEIVEICESLGRDDYSLANPRIKSILGQALINDSSQNIERARECFREAESMKFRDTGMMRNWYYMEVRSGYGIAEAKRICNTMISMPGATKRLKSEFVSKLAWCNYNEAQSLSSVSTEKSSPLFRISIEQYLESIWLAEQVPGMSVIDNLIWLDRPISGYLRMLRGEVNPYVKMIEELPALGHDVPLEGAKALLRGLVNAYIPNDVRTRRKVAGLFTRATSKLSKYLKDPDDMPGLAYLADMLEEFADRLATAGS